MVHVFLMVVCTSHYTSSAELMNLNMQRQTWGCVQSQWSPLGVKLRGWHGIRPTVKVLVLSETLLPNAWCQPPAGKNADLDVCGWGSRLLRQQLAGRQTGAGRKDNACWWRHAALVRDDRDIRDLQLLIWFFFLQCVYCSGFNSFEITYFYGNKSTSCKVTLNNYEIWKWYLWIVAMFFNISFFFCFFFPYFSKAEIHDQYSKGHTLKNPP